MFFKKMLSVKRLMLAAALVALSVLLVGVIQAQDEEADEPVLLIGTITNETDLFVGLSIDGEDATLYICDGQADKGTISIGQWFVGKVVDGAIAVTAANGNQVEVTLNEEEETASGKFTFTDGTIKEFVLTLAEDEAALLRSEFAFGDHKYIGGWLVLANGDIRGSVFEVDTETLVPATLTGPTIPKKNDTDNS
ncbi:MAG TPA: hypothetical protein VHL11_25690 [Phototrophicaceae bacterium]|jgi:hypothetical protein|nr:hypothetical protein [Phototrophicaceae bacterium]